MIFRIVSYRNDLHHTNKFLSFLVTWMLCPLSKSCIMLLTKFVINACNFATVKKHEFGACLWGALRGL